MSRPYSSNSIEELEALFEKNMAVSQVLDRLLEELGHRKTKRALHLLSRVAQRLSDFGPDEVDPSDNSELTGPNFHDPPAPSSAGGRDDNRSSENPSEPQGLFGSDAQNFELPPDDRQRPQRLSRMRPPNTSGLPNPWVRSLDQSLTLDVSSDSDIATLYVSALGALISEIKKTGAGQKRYELENGVQVDSPTTETIYSFPFSEEADLFEDAQIEVEVHGKRVDGSVVSISAGNLLLAMKEDLGPKIARAVLLIDATALLEALKEKIEQVQQGEITLNRALADAVIGQSRPPSAPSPIPVLATDHLDLAQTRALERALTAPVCYIWGPPGSGKTRTLGEIVRATFENEKRILVCSNTNKAVDQVLYRICETLGHDHLAMDMGRIVRVGRIADDKLKAKYEAFVTVDGIVERRTVELEARKREIEEEIERLDKRTADARKLLERFEELDRIERNVGLFSDETNTIAREGKRLKTEHSSSNDKLNTLIQELANRNASRFRFFKRSEAIIRRDIETNQTRCARLAKEIETTNLRYLSSREKYEQAMAARNRQQQSLEGKDRKATETEVAAAKGNRDQHVAELREIETKIADIRQEIMREARILGATCTKSYLSAKEIGQFDLVIIDEASMVIMPMAWFASGLARERVVICGDFRQIPPIVQTNQQAIFDVLGHDVFAKLGLIAAPESDERLVILDQQFRMDEEICELINQPMYAGILKTAQRQKATKRPLLPIPLNRTLTIVDTSDLWPFEGVNAFYSRYNLMHSLLVRNLTWHLHKEGSIQEVYDLGICTPYAAQARLIRKLLDHEGFASLVQVGTVHSFQGDERRTIVLEIPESHGGGRMLGQFVRGVPPEHVGARLLNVAVSRAQDHLIVLANLTHLDKHLPSLSLLRSILFDMQEKGRVVPGRDILELRPIERDLQGILGRIKLDIDAETLGIFNQQTFDPAVMDDIKAATESIVIFSGFITPRRVSAIGDLLRAKIADGVRVRCVTRPPKRNGTMDPALGKEALDMLEGIGCVIDCRGDIHEKVVLIDKKIVWHGSLNFLSHSHRTDESMTRLVNAGYGQAIAANMSKLRMSDEKAVQTVADAENPRCPNCNSRTVYQDGRFGPFFYCEDEEGCKWRVDLKKMQRGKRGQSNEPAPNDLRKDGPNCPNCGSKTQLRHGKYGPFYGCVDYPKCEGTVDASGKKKKAAAKKPRGARRKKRGKKT